MDSELDSSSHILILGDLILDEFVWGKVRRISPEAPVPVVEVERRELYPGGAANVARNLAPFVSGAGMIGRMGKDVSGERLLALFAEQGIDFPVALLDENLPTIVKTRIIARQQQMARVDEEKIKPLRQQEKARILEYVATNVERWSAVILQDYAKGFFDQQLVDELTSLLQGKVVVTADPNPRNRLLWKGCHTVKPNRLEAFAAVGMTDPDHHPSDPASDATFLEVGNRLLQLWQPQYLLLTLGDLGMLLFDAKSPENPQHLAAQASEVFDVSGAGDTAIGFYTWALASGWAARDAAWLANAASSRVVEKVGTATLTKAELTQLLAKK